jgi:16S rRNA (guanine527-N7)-methyltransferase
VIDGLDVSRETFDKLQQLHALLLKWNPVINLVSKSTLSDSWERHVLDSLQVFDQGPESVENWLDLGSGGGFPGLVVAILGTEGGRNLDVTMIESDQRKCQFLRTVLRETGSKGTVLNERIELSKPQHADVISARAVADLSTLFGFAERHLADDGICLFPKGITWQKEITKAQESWSFEYEAIRSKIEPNAVILKVGDIRRV